MPTPAEVAAAWHSVTDEWFTRRNKMNRASEQWEVIHDWGGDVVSDDTRIVVASFSEQEMAEELARTCEDNARGKAVLDLIGG